MNTATAKKTSIKFILEGVELLVLSAHIQETNGATPSCTINLGVNKYAPFILPGSVGQLFYEMNGKMYLVFEGELANLSMSKSTLKRNVSLQFVGLTNFLSHAWIHSIDFSMESVTTKPFFVNVSKYNSNGKAADQPETPDSLESRGYSETEEDAQAIYDSKKPGEANILLSPLTTFTTILQTMQNLLNEPETYSEANPIKYMITTVLEEAFRVNPYLALQNKVYKLIDRIYVFNNSQAKKLVSSQNFIDHVRGSVGLSKSVISIKDLITTMCDYLGYTWVELAAPCLVGGKLKSIIIKPNMNYMLPILTNVVYPNQYSNFNYSRNYLKEPTRYCAKSTPLSFVVSKGKALDGFFMTVAPSVELKRVGGNIKHEFTQEEKYKGVYPATEPQMDYLSQAYIELGATKDTPEDFVGPDPLTNSPDNSSTVQQAYVPNEMEKISGSILQQNMQRLADRRFFELRARSKSASFNADYSPFRMVGFPGVLLDTELPNTVGTFASISSSFSAGGNASQTIHIEAPRQYITDKLDFGLEQAPQFPQYYSSGYVPQNIGTRFQGLIQNPVAAVNNDQASTYVYIKEWFEQGNFSGEDARGDNESLSNHVHRLSFKHAINQYSSFANSNKYSYTQKHTERALVSEKAYWEFVDLVDKDNLLSESNTRLATDLNITNADSDSNSGKMFVEERQVRVKLMQVKGVADHVI